METRVGGGGALAIIRGRRLFQIFRSKGGDYSREAINIEGRLLFEEIRYSYTGTHSKASRHPKSVHPLDRFPVLVILLVKAAAKAIP